jgi:predicted nucleotidyltransferase
MNDAFTFNPPGTAELSLDSFLERLQAQPTLDAILLLGSTAGRQFNPHSDLDILLVFTEIPVALFSLVTRIEGLLADIYLMTTAELERLLAADLPLDANSMDGKVLGWIAAGEIVLDRGGRLASLREKGSAGQATIVSEGEKFARWFGINFNYLHNRRYFESGDATYLAALRLRLTLYCLSDLLMAYLALRDIPWQGEKTALAYLAEHDPAFLALFYEAISEPDITQQFKKYEALIRRCLPPPYQLYAGGFEGVTLKEEYSAEKVAAGKRWWAAFFRV